MVTRLAHWDSSENHQSLITLGSRWIIQTAFPTHRCKKSVIETQSIHHQALLAERCFYHLFCDLIVWPVCLIKGMQVVVLDILQKKHQEPLKATNLTVHSSKYKETKGRVSYNAWDFLIMPWWSVNSIGSGTAPFLGMGVNLPLPSKVLNVLCVLSPFPWLVSQKWPVSHCSYIESCHNIVSP